VLLRLHHVGLIVRDLEATSVQYTEKLGLRLDRVEDYGDGLLRIGFLVCGDVFLELIQPLTDDGPNAAWLRTVGEGIQHLAFEVGDVNGTLAELTARGVPLLDRGARPGRVGHAHRLSRPARLRRLAAGTRRGDRRVARRERSQPRRLVGALLRRRAAGSAPCDAEYCNRRSPQSWGERSAPPAPQSWGEPGDGVAGRGNEWPCLGSARAGRRQA
jgi:methylmalonyl-CoA epimerase